MEFMAPNAVELSAEPLVGLDQIRAGMTKQFKLPGFKITWEPTKAEFLGRAMLATRSAGTKFASTVTMANP